MRLESLEDRRLLSASLPGMHLGSPSADRFDGQIVYLNFDGAADLVYRGPKTVRDIDLPAFSAGLGDRQAIIEGIVAGLNKTFAGSGVIFTTDKPAGGEYSTVYIGGGGADFARYGSFNALAEAVDVGNVRKSDAALVFSDRLLRVKPTLKGFATSTQRLIAHEVGHLLGYIHDDHPLRGGKWADVAEVSKQAIGRVLDVPHYSWFYGCAPTAIGVIMGYWDQRGFGNLIPGDASAFTDNVKDAIAGPAHRISGAENKPTNPLSPPGRPMYFGWGDWHNSPSYPNHENNPSSIADYIRTLDGVTYMEGLNWGMGRWLGSRGQTGWSVSEEQWGEFTWSDLVYNIDRHRPILAVVDRDANGVTDHGTAVVGYNSTTGQMAVWDSVANDVTWHEFGAVQAGREYGIESVRYIVPPKPTVEMFTVKQTATEDGTKFGVIRVERTGGPTVPLTVYYELGGTATWAADYKKIGRYAVVIPEGQSYVNIKIVAKADGVAEPRESVLVTLSGSADYNTGARTLGKVLIYNVQ